MITPIQEIKSFIAENRTGDALSRLLELSQNNKQVNDAIHIVLAEFNDLASQRIKGTIENSELSRRQNIIHDKMLIALGAFDSQGRVLPGSVMVKNKPASSIILRISLFFGVVGIVAGIIEYSTKERKTNVLSGGGNYMFMSLMLGLGFWILIAYIIALIVESSKAK